MRKSKIIKWNEKDVVCKELTVEEISTLMASDAEPGALDLVFFDRSPAMAVTMSTGLTHKDLEGFPPSELETLWDAVEEVNPFFTKMLGQLAEKGRKLVDLT